MKINQITGLNILARKFLLEHCISKRGAEVMVFDFCGFINGQYLDRVSLIRTNSKWEVLSTKERILTISGIADSFSLTKNTLGL